MKVKTLVISFGILALLVFTNATKKDINVKFQNRALLFVTNNIDRLVKENHVEALKNFAEDSIGIVHYVFTRKKTDIAYYLSRSRFDKDITLPMDVSKKIKNKIPISEKKSNRKINRLNTLRDINNLSDASDFVISLKETILYKGNYYLEITIIPIKNPNQCDILFRFNSTGELQAYYCFQSIT